MPQSRFQSFADLGGPAQVKPRIAALRAALAAENLAGFVIPRADRHQNEYLPPDQERLLWATGFSGSAGLAIVLQDKAALFIDGRYTVQADSQTDVSVFERLPAGEKAAQNWLKQNLKKGDALGFDPWLHTSDFVQETSELCEALGARFVALQPNPIDALWTDRPAPPCAPITIRPLRLAGERAEAKLARVRQNLERRRARGQRSPQHRLGVQHPRRRRRPHAAAARLRAGSQTGAGAAVHRAREADADGPRTPGAGRDAERSRRVSEAALVAEAKAGRKLAFDKATAPYKLIDAFGAAGGKFSLRADPMTLMKACKNAAEIAGAQGRAPARRRGDGEVPRLVRRRHGRQGRDRDRRGGGAGEFPPRDPSFRDISFPTIAAAGPHAAIPHYRVSEGSTSRSAGPVPDRQRRPV